MPSAASSGTCAINFKTTLNERDASVVPAGLPRTLLDMEELVDGAPLTPAFVEDAVPYFSEFVRD